MNAYWSFLCGLAIGAGGIVVWWLWQGGMEEEVDDDFDDLLNGYDYHDGPPVPMDDDNRQK